MNRALPLLLLLPALALAPGCADDSAERALRAETDSLRREIGDLERRNAALAAELEHRPAEPATTADPRPAATDGLEAEVERLRRDAAALIAERDRLGGDLEDLTTRFDQQFALLQAMDASFERTASEVEALRVENELLRAEILRLQGR